MKTATALILLPIEYNPDEKNQRRQVSIKAFQDTAIEITRIFEKYDLGCTIDPYPKHGVWVKLGILYEDVNTILEINNFPITEKKQLIKYCEEKLLKRFEQEAILIKFIPEVQAEVVTIKKGDNQG